MTTKVVMVMIMAVMMMMIIINCTVRNIPFIILGYTGVRRDVWAHDDNLPLLLGGDPILAKEYETRTNITQL